MQTVMRIRAPRTIAFGALGAALAAAVLVGAIQLRKLLIHTSDRSQITLFGRITGAEGTNSFQKLAFNFYDPKSKALVHRAIADVEVQNHEYCAVMPSSGLESNHGYLVYASMPNVEAPAFAGGQNTMAIPYVYLQSSTPGMQQTGHVNISGTLIAGTVQTSAFKMPTGAGVGKVLTSDASGIGTWQTSPTSFWQQSAYGIYYNNGFVGVGRSAPLTGAEVFGINSTFGGYGGMYVSTPSGSLPFYGYASGSTTAWTFLDGSDGNKWKLFDNGTQLTVTPEGRVGIGTTSPTYKVQVIASGGDDAVHAVQTNTAGFEAALFGESASDSGYGVVGRATSGSSSSHYGVYGISWGSGGVGTYGVTMDNTGYPAAILGEGRNAANGTGVVGYGNPTGGYFSADSSYGVGAWGVGHGDNAYGLYGYATYSPNSYYAFGVFGQVADSNSYGVYSVGRFAATGTKSFQIDHPLDPENAFLNHYCTEGPEPLDVYSGNVITDSRGYATVTLPRYFEAINKDFRYQLTVIDSSDDFVLAKVVREIENNQFVIRTSQPSIKVSWRVEATRNDPWVRKYGYKSEEPKPAPYRGKYLNPELYGAPPDRAIHQMKKPRGSGGPIVAH